MALFSMTGFARQAGTLPDGSGFVWELRSVNGRGLDVRLRLPPGHEALEAKLRDAAAARFKRGNISATLSVKKEERPAPRLTPDPAALEQALALALEVAARIPGCPAPRAESILLMPGVLRSEVPEAREGEEEGRHAAISTAFLRALEDLETARREEGEKLAGILSALLDEIEALRQRGATLAAEQPAAHRARLTAALAELLEGERRVPEERLAVEVALLAQKSDVREELDRLAAHVQAARALLAGGEPAGRRLEFLTQEFGREANTLGAKSASLGLTGISLDLKAAIERLREQAANVE